MRTIENGKQKTMFLNNNAFQMEIAGKNWKEICNEIIMSLKEFAA
jgi:hypothetical protein